MPPQAEESRVAGYAAAAEVRLLDQHGNVHRLADYYGRSVVIYFYPKDSDTIDKYET